MKTSLNKTQAREKINQFFSKTNFNSEELKKIKRLAMKFNIKLKDYKKMFCKKCLSHLKGQLSITKTHKTIKCSSCGFKNKLRIA